MYYPINFRYTRKEIGLPVVKGGLTLSINPSSVGETSRARNLVRLLAARVVAWTVSDFLHSTIPYVRTL